MINVGIIGAGRIGKVHVESICTQVKDAKVKMLADPFMNDETAKWAKDMGVEAVTKDYKEILADPEIDAVLICSSTDTHSPISVEAIKAGKHVFCEKPIDHDVAKIKEVIDALKDSNVKYQVGFNRRFDHNFEAVQKAVADGKIGDTHIIKITSRDPEPPCADYVKVSGGIFLDMTIHDFDMVRFLAGCNATEVYVEATVLEKKVYTITDAGKEAFKKWEETLYPMPSLPKDEFRLQLFFSHLASPEFRIQLLQDQLSQHLDRLNYLKEDMEKFTVLPPVDDELFTDYLVLSGGIAREEAMCDWLKNCIRLCKSRSTL